MAIAINWCCSGSRHLKWPALDKLELALISLRRCCASVFAVGNCDIVTRRSAATALAAGSHLHAFHLRIFIGAAVAPAATTSVSDRDLGGDLHGTPRLIVEIIIRLVVIGVAFGLIWFGYITTFRGFGSFRLPRAHRSPRLWLPFQYPGR